MKKTSQFTSDRTHIPAYSQKPHSIYISRPDTNIGILALILLHIPLAYLMKEFSAIATMHAVMTFLVGLVWLSDRKPIRLIYLTAYISGVEILWRATDAGVFYEFGKYSIILLLTLAMLKYRRLGSAKKAPFLFFLLLVPSLLVLPYFDREDIAFNLSGPLTLAVSSMFFSTVILEESQLKQVLLSMIAPIVGMTFLASFFTLSVEAIDFTGQSIKATSAFTGPNQVSTMLGLGAMLAFYYALIEKRDPLIRAFMVILSLWMIAQTLLTFSRGGFWTAGGALLIGIYYLQRKGRSRFPLIFLTIVFVLLVGLVLLPQLDRFTGGLLISRYVNFETTGRTDIISTDIKTFQEHPMYGVGPGQSAFFHDTFEHLVIAHTEFSRLLAEHGLLGFGALLILVVLSARRILNKSSTNQKSFSAMFTSWALLTMLHSAMRLAAPGFAFGLGGAQLGEKGELDKSEATIPNRYRRSIFTPVRSKKKHGI